MLRFQGFSEENSPFLIKISGGIGGTEPDLPLFGAFVLQSWVSFQVICQTLRYNFSLCY